MGQDWLRVVTSGERELGSSGRSCGTSSEIWWDRVGSGDFT